MYINNKPFTARRFSSGELKLLHQDLQGYVKNNKVNIVYNNDELSLFELMIIINYYTSKNIIVDLTLSYLPYQRMNHDNGYEVETLKHIANIFNNLKLNSLKVGEPHCKLNYFNNAQKINIIEKLFKKVCKEINFNLNSDILFFTDKGSREKFGHLSTNSVYSEKVRDKKTGLIAQYNLVGELKNANKILIVDDIISSGDTICEAIKQIKKNFKTSALPEIFILSAHYENNKYNKRLLENKYVKKIFSCNTLRKTEATKLKLYDFYKLVEE